MASANDGSSWVLERLLVLQCQTGDGRAFEELVARYDRRLRYYLRHLLHHSESIEDMIQDVWLEVVRGIAGLRSAAAFRSWLYRIARNRVFAELRRSCRLPRTESEVDELIVNEPEFSAEDAADVHKCLGRLSVEHREVLLLHFVEDMSYAEIAETVGCKLGTVRSRLHCAKLAMRREMERTRHG